MGNTRTAVLHPEWPVTLLTLTTMWVALFQPLPDNICATHLTVQVGNWET